MEKINGSLLSDYPFSNAEKVADLLYYDEPILSHYTFKGKNFLHYLIDFDDDLSRYLIFQIQEYELYKLLYGIKSLRTILEQSSKDFMFQYIADFNFFNNTNISYQITLDVIQEKYLPNDDSIFQLADIKNEYYNSLKFIYQETYYIEQLRKKAYYLKFEPNNNHYDSSLGILELSNLLNLVSESFRNFTRIDFYKSFKDKITNKTKLNQLYNRLKEYTDSRAVEFNYGSFEVGISIDKVLKKGVADSKEIQYWLEDVEEKFKENVLEVNYEDEEQINSIIQENNYTQSELVEIYKPILKIAQDSEHTFEYKGSKEKDFKKIKTNNKIVIEKLTKKDMLDNVDEPEKLQEFEYINVIIPKEIGKTMTSKIKLENTLFNITNNFVLNNDNFSQYGFKYDYIIEIQVNLSSKEKQSILNATYDNIEFNVVGNMDNLKELSKSLVLKIAEYIANRDEA